jgi:transcriptional regulator GlxA family with amidase domain
MAGQSTRIRVSLVATPDAMVSPVSGLFETLAGAAAMAEPAADRSTVRRFELEIVGPSGGQMQGASGLPITVHRSVDEVDSTDVVIVPSMEMTATGDWIPGRYPGIVRWISKMHEGGATICSACSGGMLMAETGLLDGHEATIHWASEVPFRARHPNVSLRMDEALVVSGDGDRIVCSGAATAWHDLAMYLIARYLGPATAQAVARFHLLQWHSEGQAAFKVFNPPTDHGDAAVLTAQRWIAEHAQVANPIEKMADRAGLSTRTLARRFKQATGQSPVAYVQRVRIELAKRSLETGGEPIEEISWAVGYEDSASFRRLFKRLTGLTPGEYRHRFRMPKLAGIPDR